MAGLGLLVLSDATSSGGDSGGDRLKGDLLCAAGAVLYALSNTGQERFVKQHSRLEFLSFLGIFGSMVRPMPGTHAWTRATKSP